MCEEYREWHNAFLACVFFSCSVLCFDLEGEPEETNYTAAGAAVNTM